MPWPSNPQTGTLIDPFGGLADLENRILKAVDVPEERFSEDGLRVLRAARFVATLEMELDPATARAIEPTLATYKKVSAERVRDEWVKTMKARRPSRAFDVMRTTGILAVTCPELLEGVGMEQNRYHAYDVWRHGMECLDACAGDATLRMAALFHDIGKPRTRAVGRRPTITPFTTTSGWEPRWWSPSASAFASQRRTATHHRSRSVPSFPLHRRVDRRDGTPLDTAVGPARVEDLYLLNAADCLAKGRDVTDDLAALAALKSHVAEVLARGAALSTRDLKINGRDLMTHFALRPGPILGEVLQALLEAVTNEPELNDREALLVRASVLVAERLATLKTP